MDKNAVENANMVTSSTSENAGLQEPLQMVQILLQDMQDKFQAMTEQIISRIDDMGHRINELESNISELMEQSEGTEESSSGAQPDGTLQSVPDPTTNTTPAPQQTQ